MILDDIVRDKRLEIERHRRERSPSALAERTAWAEERRGFRAALEKPGRSIIAEVKKASPSRGVLREDFDPVALARAYERGGARAISVLTDEPYFQGRLEYLEAVRAETTVPLLRKDFVVDPYQIVEARAFGADAVLLICAILDDGELRELQAAAGEHRLDVLVEVHTAEEAARAARAGAKLVGINHRDLRTFETRLEVSEEIVPLLPSETTIVAESGLASTGDLERLERLGVDAFLIGESLVVARDPEARLREWSA